MFNKRRLTMKSGQRIVSRIGLVVMLLVFFSSGQVGAKNLILNGEFDEPVTQEGVVPEWNSGWLNTDAGVDVVFSVNSDGLLSGDNCWQMDILNGGGTDYFIQRVQNLPLETGVTYTLTFMGMMESAEAERSITAVFENGASGNYYRYLSETVTLTTDPTEFGPFVCTPDTSDPTVQLKFFPGGSNDVIVYLDAIVVDDGEPETAVEEQVASLPSVFSLEQNFPNPFNPTTEIGYDLPSASHVALTVFDLTGKTVATLVNESQDAGSHSVSFDARNLPSGTYLYRLDAGNSTFTKKMMLIK
jgi:hypothetical protein